MQSKHKTPIQHKYDNLFNFYQAKSINHIIHNRTSEISNILAKDIAILVEDIDYLKRYYYTQSYGNNQINDRMALLIKFYSTANMLQYQYPLMVVTHTQNIFKNRRKKLAQSHTEDQHSSISAQPFSQQNILVQQQGEDFFDKLDWSDILTYKQQPKQSKKTYQFDQSFSIYQERPNEPKKELDFFSRITKLADQLTYQFNLDAHEAQRQVSHLIVDFDDLDKQRVVRQYQKLTNKENIPINKSFTITHLNDKKPLSSSITIDTLKESTFLDRGRSNALNRQSMFIGSREQRQNQIKVMKKSSDLKQKVFVFSQDMVINQHQCEQSPIHEPPMNNYSFVPNHKPMKQSQIIHNDYFIKDKHHPYDFEAQINKLKENPFQIKPKPTQIIQPGNNFKKAISKHHQLKPAPNLRNKAQILTSPSKNQLPFYLKRVKSSQQLKSPISKGGKK